MQPKQWTDSAIQMAPICSMVPRSTCKYRKGEWATIVYTYADGVAKFYTNGNLVMKNLQVVSFTPQQYDILIGKTLSTQYPYWFNGAIDEIRIYEKALCEAEVKALSELKN